MSLKYTENDFIKRAKEVHGEKYDYSKVKYVNSKTDVTIICPIHGEYKQKPYNHYKGCGCPICGGTKKNTNDNFIEMAKQIHGDKYDYSKVDYKNNSTKVCIVCPIHGEFWQTPLNHLQGKGCQKCKGKNLTNNEKILKAKSIHGDKYDYSLSDFSKVKNKTVIICPIHGEFLMDYDHHVNVKNGCPKCSNNQKYTIEEYELKAKEKHNSFYQYNQDYKNMHSKIKIICPIHGEFYQLPLAHLRGQGCPKCVKQPKLEKEIEKILNENNIKYITQVGSKKFKWLGFMSLDFFLPQYNIAIECQGSQHFEPRDFSGHDKDKALHNYNVQKERDLRKFKLCKENNIQVLYYTNYKNVKNYFTDIFQDKNKLITKIKN